MMGEKMVRCSALLTSRVLLVFGLANACGSGQADRKADAKPSLSKPESSSAGIGVPASGEQTGKDRVSRCAVGVDTDGDGKSERIEPPTYGVGGLFLSENGRKQCVEIGDADGPCTAIWVDSPCARRTEDPGEVSCRVTRSEKNETIAELGPYPKEDGRVGYDTRCVYDSGQRLSLEEFGKDPRLTPEKAVSYKYDGSGQLTEKSTDIGLDDSIEHQVICTYADDGNLLERKGFNFGGWESLGSERFEFAYDTSGNLLTELAEFEIDGRIRRDRTAFIYDEAGRLQRMLVMATEMIASDGSSATIGDYWKNLDGSGPVLKELATYVYECDPLAVSGATQ